MLNNPVYKKSPFYPFADDVQRKAQESKRANAVIEDLYKKIKNNYKDKMTELIVGGEQAAEGASGSMFREFFLKQLEIDSRRASAFAMNTDDEFDGSKSAARASEFSRRTKSRKDTSRSQTPSRSPTYKSSSGYSGKRKGKKSKASNPERRQAISETERRNLEHYV